MSSSKTLENRALMPNNQTTVMPEIQRIKNGSVGCVIFKYLRPIALLCLGGCATMSGTTQNPIEAMEAARKRLLSELGPKVPGQMEGLQDDGTAMNCAEKGTMEDALEEAKKNNRVLVGNDAKTLSFQVDTVGDRGVACAHSSMKKVVKVVKSLGASPTSTDAKNDNKQEGGDNKLSELEQNQFLNYLAAKMPDGLRKPDNIRLLAKKLSQLGYNKDTLVDIRLNRGEEGSDYVTITVDGKSFIGGSPEDKATPGYYAFLDALRRIETSKPKPPINLIKFRDLSGYISNKLPTELKNTDNARLVAKKLMEKGYDENTVVNISYSKDESEQVFVTIILDGELFRGGHIRNYEALIKALERVTPKLSVK